MRSRSWTGRARLPPSRCAGRARLPPSRCAARREPRPPNRGRMARPLHAVLLSKRKETAMPRGDKSAYTEKQKRQAEHIEEGYEKRGVPKEEAERRAWATENKISHG